DPIDDRIERARDVLKQFMDWLNDLFFYRPQEAVEASLEIAEASRRTQHRQEVRVDEGVVGFAIVVGVLTLVDETVESPFGTFKSAPPVREGRVDEVGGVGDTFGVGMVAAHLSIGQESPRRRQTEFGPVLQAAVDVGNPVVKIGGRRLASRVTLVRARAEGR